MEKHILNLIDCYQDKNVLDKFSISKMPIETVMKFICFVLIRCKEQKNYVAFRSILTDIVIKRPLDKLSVACLLFTKINKKLDYVFLSRSLLQDVEKYLFEILYYQGEIAESIARKMVACFEPTNKMISRILEDNLEIAPNSKVFYFFNRSCTINAFHYNVIKF